MLKSGAQRLSASFLQEDRVSKWVYVYDCRFGNKEDKGELLETTDLDFNDFRQLLLQAMLIS